MVISRLTSFDTCRDRVSRDNEMIHATNYLLETRSCERQQCCLSVWNTTHIR